MKPLREENEKADAVDGLLGRLMRSVGPLPASEVRMRRVLTSVRSRAPMGSAPSARRTRRTMMRPAFAAAVLLLIGGIAGATVGRAAWDRLTGAAPVPAPAALPAVSLQGSPGAALSQAPPVVASVPVALPPNAANLLVGPALAVAPGSLAPSSAEPRALAAHARHSTIDAGLSRGEFARPTRSLPPAAATAPTPSSGAPDNVDEPLDSANALVIAARKAWRHDNDPARARVLLDDYLRHNPDGMVAEDALATLISVTAELEDPEAGSLARKYLARYPSGRFQELAQRAILRFPGSANR